MNHLKVVGDLEHSGSVDYDVSSVDYWSISYRLRQVTPNFSSGTPFALRLRRHRHDQGAEHCIDGIRGLKDLGDIRVQRYHNPIFRPAGESVGLGLPVVEIILRQ